MNIRNCFIKTRGNRNCRCMKCGHIVREEAYERNKHARFCGFSSLDYKEILISDKDFGYLLSDEKDGLSISICTPKSVEGYGVQGEWSAIYKVLFMQDFKEPIVLLGEAKDLISWLKKIDKKELAPIHRESDLQVVRKVFPIIVDIASFCMFYKIYKTKGFSFHNPISEKQAKCYFNGRIPGENEDGKYVYTKTYERAGKLILKVILRDAGKWTGFLFSEEYVYTTGYINLEELFHQSDFKYCTSFLKDITIFYKRYPSFGIEKYLEMGGVNIFIPLLSGHYHSGIELLAKSGCSGLAECLDKKYFQKDPFTYSNVKELLGMNLTAARLLTSEVLYHDSYIVELIRDIYQYKPEYIQVRKLTPVLLDFYDRNHFILTGNFPRIVSEIHVARCINSMVNWIDADAARCYDELKKGDLKQYKILNKKMHLQVIKMIKYLETDQIQDYAKYLEYLEMCEYLKYYKEGMMPKDFAAAYQKVREYYVVKRSGFVSENYQSAIKTKEYKRLATHVGMDQTKFYNEDFQIVLPRSEVDLYVEGQMLNHCVFRYTSSVAGGKTRIVFLRKKENIEKPFATIEVNNSDQIIQVKGHSNTKVPPEAKAFVRKWAEVKGLKVHTTDME